MREGVLATFARQKWPRVRCAVSAISAGALRGQRFIRAAKRHKKHGSRDLRRGMTRTRDMDSVITENRSCVFCILTVHGEK
jgi:hypothetical protein